MSLPDEFTRDLLDQLNDGVYFVDTDRKIFFWNHGAETITGYTTGDVLNHCCAENILRHVDEKGNHLCENGCPLTATLRDGKPRQDEVYLHHHDGYRVPVTVRANPLRDAQGNIIGGIEVFAVTANNARMRRNLEHLLQAAMIDPLTEMGNRKYIENELNHAIARCQGLQTADLGVIFVDVDHFKQVNDTHGHPAGDRVLKMVTTTLMNGLRSLDVVGRWGGEEFLAVIPGVNEQKLAAVAERVRMLVANSWREESGITIRATISVGATLWQPGETAEVLIDRADQLMYRSKAEGRNRVTLG